MTAVGDLGPAVRLLIPEGAMPPSGEALRRVNSDRALMTKSSAARARFGRTMRYGSGEKS